MHLTICLLACSCVSFCALSPARAGEWKLIWSDEFDYQGHPDPRKWDYEDGFARNREEQYYTRNRLENARVENGVLVIEGRIVRGVREKERYKNAKYTAASLITRNKASWRYGRIEVKAKLPRGQGVWPAIWMVGNSWGQIKWPQCGEIDIMEYVGRSPHTVHANVHYRMHGKHRSKSGTHRTQAPYDAFHVYAIEWFPDRLDFYFDRTKYHTFRIDDAGAGPDNPFRRPHFLLINLALGGSWGGTIDESIFPQKYLIDYVRVYRHKNAGTYAQLPPPAKAEAEAAPAGPRTLFDFEGGFDTRTLDPHDVHLSVRRGPKSHVLRMAFGHTIDWPGITFKPPGRDWNLTDVRDVVLDVTNRGTDQATVYLRVDNPDADGGKNSTNGNVSVEPGATEELRVPLYGTPRRFDRFDPYSPEEGAKVKIVGMRGVPGPSAKLDLANIVQFILFVNKPDKPHLIEIDNVRVEGTVTTLSFPFIDEYGQFIHGDWPGKTKGPGDFAARRGKEARDLAGHPGPTGWNGYGGWTRGPQLESTGHFRPQKYHGKWWLVDPDGRLFWSHGIDCVNTWSGSTPISDREHYFKKLPGEEFLGWENWAPHGYYAAKGRYRSANFRSVNLKRKYGSDWKKAYTDITHRRVRSWGMNTIANWAESTIYLERRTPYVVAIHCGGPVIEGSMGYWKKFPDPFDPGCRQALRGRLEKERGKSAGDRWCIGYFVSNELSWGSETSLAESTLASPPGQAAKKTFVDDLRKKYASVGDLNRAWGTSHASWDALLESRTPPDRKKANADLKAFYTRLAEEYFRVCREEVKRVAPDNLYLGCRFAWVNDRAVRAAAKYCDVISYNFYRDQVDDFTLPGGINMPVVVGEFHFGALDRGMFHTGLKKARDQADRAAKYARYVTGALKNPTIVGTHWFQYGDQATTGRGDGENYQIGFIDICDTPYPETVEACREVGYDLYRTRADR